MRDRVAMILEKTGDVLGYGAANSLANGGLAMVSWYLIERAGVDVERRHGLATSD